MKFIRLSFLSFLLNQRGSIGFPGQKFRLMNEADDLGDGGGDSSVDLGDDSGYVDDSADESIDGSWEDAFKEIGLDSKKYGLGTEETPIGQNGDSGQEQKATEGAAQGTEDTSLLEKLNGLGLIHNELPFSVESLDQVKTLIQQGYDYTPKLQALSEERKVFETERDATKTELNAAIEEFNTQQRELAPRIQELQQWTFALGQLAKEDPDLFSEVQSRYENVQKQFSNPVLDQQLAAIRAENAEIKKSLASREDKLIVDSFESDKKALNATEQSLKELGINVDWNEVKKQWAATGLPVKQVLGSIYFDSLAKAQASKAKVETTKAKVAARPTGGAGASRPGGKVQAIDPKLKGFALAQKLLERYTSN